MSGEGFVSSESQHVGADDVDFCNCHFQNQAVDMGAQDFNDSTILIDSAYQSGTYACLVDMVMICLVKQKTNVNF